MASRLISWAFANELLTRSLRHIFAHSASRYCSVCPVSWSHRRRRSYHRGRSYYGYSASWSYSDLFASSQYPRRGTRLNFRNQNSLGIQDRLIKRYTFPWNWPCSAHFCHLDSEPWSMSSHLPNCSPASRSTAQRPALSNHSSLRSASIASVRNHRSNLARLRSDLSKTRVFHRR